MPIGRDELKNRFGWHKPTGEGPINTGGIHADMRLRFENFAAYLDVVLPDGREKDISIAQLETAAMWAHKAVAMQDPVVAAAVKNLAESSDEIKG